MSDNTRPGGEDGRTGIILLYHGSAGNEWMAHMEWMAGAVRDAIPSASVLSACLKEFPPSLEDSVSSLAAGGAESILVVPMFIGPGGHALRDFPPIIESMKNRWPHIRFTWTPVAGAWEEVAEAVARGIGARLDGK